MDTVLWKSDTCRSIEMFDFLRNLGRSEDEKQQEAVSAYLDNELAPADRDRFEQQLALNSSLQDELAEMQLWQQQMRDLPVRRVPRNFTLDPALYGRSQRQPLAGAYPMLRSATAVTAFLFVIALAANLYLGSISGDTASQPASVAMQEMAPVADEAELAGVATSAIEMAAEEQPETFMLEESIDKEADEVPVEIVELEEATAKNAEEEVLSAEAETVEGDALLSEKPGELLPLSPALEMIEETAQPPVARDIAAAPPAQAAVVEEDGVQRAEEAPQPTATLDQAEDQVLSSAESQELVQPAFEDDAVPAAPSLMTGTLGPVVIGLGLLFIFLTMLTLLARIRR